MNTKGLPEGGPFFCGGDLRYVNRKSQIVPRTSPIAHLSKFYLSLPPENAKYNKL